MTRATRGGIWLVGFAILDISIGSLWGPSVAGIVAGAFLCAIALFSRERSDVA